MKESEFLKQEMNDYSNEDGDMGFFKLKEKYDRAIRFEMFQENTLPWLENRFSLEYNENNNSYKFKTEKHGVLQYYPKKDRLHRHNPRKWFDNGLQWLKREFKGETNQPLNDKSRMTFGKYSGKKMEDIPAWYLLYIYENKAHNSTILFQNYVCDNFDRLEERKKLENL